MTALIAVLSLIMFLLVAISFDLGAIRRHLRSIHRLVEAEIDRQRLLASLRNIKEEKPEHD